jgi:hypothetical protein
MMNKPRKNGRPKAKLPDSTENLAGKRFGKWVALEYRGMEGSKRLWLCRCQCGVEKIVTRDNLRSKRTTQCQRCAWTSRRKPHKRLHRMWKKLLLSADVCREWQHFYAFRKAMGDPPGRGARLARYENSLPHGPENTFWLTGRIGPQVLRKRQQLREQSILQNKVLRKIRMAKTKEEKKRHIIAARKAGYTYEWIGAAAGLTHQRVQQIVAGFAK